MSFKITDDVACELEYEDIDNRFTIFDLHMMIEDETDLSPDRQILFYMGYCLNSFKNESLKDFVDDIQANGLDAVIDLIQKKAGSGDVTVWKIIGESEFLHWFFLYDIYSCMIRNKEHTYQSLSQKRYQRRLESDTSQRRKDC